MKRIVVPFTIRSPELVPRYHSQGCSGADLSADIPPGEQIVIQPGERKSVPTGVCLEIPEGYEAQVRPRSGLAIKQGITVLNTPGTIDQDYRGEIQVILVNLGSEAFHVRRGDRVAQLVFSPVVQAVLQVQTEISDTERGNGGFGSTGI